MTVVTRETTCPDCDGPTSPMSGGTGLRRCDRWPSCTGIYGLAATNRPTITRLMEFDQGGPYNLPQPLRGYYYSRTYRIIHLPFINSRTPGVEGKGYVGTLIAAMMREHDVVVVPAVISDRLEGMLMRRGFHTETHYFAGPFAGHVPCYVWRRPEAGR